MGPPADADIDAFCFRIGRRLFAVLSVPDRAPTRRALPDALTPAEHDVLRLALAGRSNREIAAARGSSIRTVANQMAVLFRKLGVGSRAQLAARVRRLPAPAPDPPDTPRTPASGLG